MNKSIIWCIIMVTLLMVVLSGCTQDIRVLPPLDRATPEEKTAVLVIPSYASVTRINGQRRGLFSSWRVGFWSQGQIGRLAATVLIPAGEHTIRFEYAHPLNAWSLRNAEMSVTVDAGKTYVLSASRGIEAEQSFLGSVINYAAFLLRDQIIENLPLLGWLPRPTPSGVLYQLLEIDQAYLEQSLFDARVPTNVMILGVIVSLVWFMLVIWGGLLLGGLLPLVGKLKNRYLLATIGVSFALSISGIILLNYNYQGNVALYAVSTVLIGFGFSWIKDAGKDAFKNAKEKLERSDFAGAISYLNEAAVLAPYNPRYVKTRALCHEKMGQFSLAIADCTKVLELKPKPDVSVLDRRSRCYMSVGQYDLAIADCTKAIETRPNFAVAYNTRGLCCFYKGQYEQAIADCTKAIEFNPNFADAYNNRSLYHSAKRQYDLAIEDCTNAIKIDPKYASAYDNRGKYYYAKKQYDLAIRDCTKAVEIDPKFAVAYDDRGRCYHAKQQYDEAIKDYSEAISLNPNVAVYYSDRGLAYHAKHQYTDAIKDYSEAIRLSPNQTVAYFTRGMCYSNKGQYDMAIADFSQDIKIYPNADAYNWRGFCYRQMGKHDLAISDFSKAIELNQNYANAYYNRGEAYKQLGKEELAILDLEKALSFDPSYEAAKKLLVKLQSHAPPTKG